MSKNVKQVAVSFKADERLAELLNQIPNKSEFIRNALMSMIATTCPLCKGQGSVSPGVHEQFQLMIHTRRQHPCVTCGKDELFPEDPSKLEPEDKARLGQFFMGGPLYCGDCYHTAPPCSDCGWHIDTQRINDHVRARHVK